MNRVGRALVPLACGLAAMACAGRGAPGAVEPDQLPACAPGLIAAGTEGPDPEGLEKARGNLLALGWISADGSVVRARTCPRLLNRWNVQLALKERYPASLRDKHLGGSVTFDVLLNSEGRVEQVQIRTPSPYGALNAAGADVLSTMHFSPAVYEGCRVPFWFNQAIIFETQ